MSTRKASVILPAALLLTPAAAWARSETPSSTEPTGDTGEIVVTANKRAENLQDVPASILAVTAAGLERANVRDFDDLVRVAPSLTISKTTQPANNSINIRGIGTYAFSIATQPSVAVVVDDVPQAFQAAAFTALVDVQQIEVLRGPQSTLFGKSASAGVINIRTMDPSDTMTARAEAVITDDHERRLMLSASGPVSDTLGVRVVGNYSQYRGNIYNLTSGKWQNGTRDITLRAKLLWRPDPALEVTVAPYYNRTDGTCCAAAEYLLSPGVTFSRANLPQSTILAGITPGPNNRLTRLDVETQADATDWGASLKLAYEIGGGLTLTSISSYDRYQLVDFKDSDGSDFDFSTLTVNGVNFSRAPRGGVGDGGLFDVETITQELRLTSPSRGRFRYVVGLFYSDSKSLRDFVRGSNFHTDFGGVIFNGVQQLPTSNALNYSSYVANSRTRTYAAFGQGTFDLTDRLSLVGGLRLHREEISYSFLDRATGVAYGSPACSTTTPTPGIAISTCDNDTVVTGKAAAQYRVTDDAMIFGSYARGYKGLAYDLTSVLTARNLITAPGPCLGIAIADCVAGRQPISPEESQAYEVGFKGSFLDRRLTWNVTGFYQTYTGFQAQSRDLELGQNILQSLGKVRTKGVESELSLNLGRLTLNASGAYNIAKIIDAPNAPCFAGQTAAEGCVGSRQDLSGKSLPSAPEWTATATGQYDFPLSEQHDGFLQATYRWQSSMLFSLSQDPDSLQEAYGILNLGAGVQTGNWKVTLFVNNLFDKNYALTKGRDNAWNFSRTAAVPTNAVNWKPARDSERYFGLRVSLKYQ